MSFYENRLLLCLSAFQGGFFWSSQPGGPDMSYERRMIYGHAMPVMMDMHGEGVYFCINSCDSHPFILLPFPASGRSCLTTSDAHKQTKCCECPDHQMHGGM